MKRLEKYIAQFDKVAVAFSSGTDSTLLAYAANRVLGHNALIYTIKTSYIPDWEIESAKSLSKKYNFNHAVIELEIHENIRTNPPDRCYHCKTKLFTEIAGQAKSDNVQVIMDGSNVDDTREFRPGMRALKELNIVSPFIELGFGKQEIRRLSREAGLPTWDTPSNACLLTRIPYNYPLTPEVIDKVKRAEFVLRNRGYEGVRVRHHDDIARIEMSKANFTGFIEDEDSDAIVSEIKNLGYNYVTLDLSGYVTGSMDEKKENE